MKKEKVQKCVRIVYHNRMSFLYIAFGYILSIWGNPLSACKICILSYVILWTFLLIGLERLIAWTFSVIIYRKDIKKEYSELKGVVYPNVVEF